MIIYNDDVDKERVENLLTQDFELRRKFEEAKNHICKSCLNVAFCTILDKTETCEIMVGELVDIWKLRENDDEYTLDDIETMMMMDIISANNCYCSNRKEEVKKACTALMDILLTVADSRLYIFNDLTWGTQYAVFKEAGMEPKLSSTHYGRAWMADHGYLYTN